VPTDANEILPALVGDAEIEPGTPVTFDAVVSVTFTVNAPLFRNPVVYLDDDDETPFQLISNDELTFTYEHEVTGQEPEAFVSVLADLVGSSGLSVTVTLGSIEVDFTPPSIQALEPTTGPLLAKGDTATIQITMSEVLPAAPTAVFDGEPMSTSGSVTAPIYELSYPLTGDEAEGSVSLAVVATDEAGNQLGPVSYDLFVTDFTPPAPPSVTLPRSTVTIGQLAAAVLVFPDSMDPAVAVEMSSGDDRIPMTVAEIVGKTFTLQYEVDGTESNGDYALTLISAADLAGNTIEDVWLGSIRIDTVAPAIVNLTHPQRASRVPGHSDVSIAFQLSEDISASHLDVRVAGNPVACAQSGTAPPAFSCTYTVGAGDNEGVFPISVVAIDAAGNNGFGGSSILFDFTPPKITTAAVSYLPALTNPAATVDRATVGTEIRVSVATDELLDTGATPSMTATWGASTLDFSLDTATDAAAFFSHTVSDSPLPGDGTYVPSISVSDLAGNQADVAFASPLILVKTSSPTLNVVQGQVSYYRSPWGAAQAEGLIPAGPHYELAPADPHASETSLPANTFSLSGSDQLQLVRVWSDSARSVLRGLLQPAVIGGTWPRLALTAQDSVGLYVTGIDRAGNESAPVAIATNHWVATPNNSVTLNPNRLVAHVTAPPAPMLGVPNEESSFDVGTNDSTDGIDGNALVQSGGFWWEERLPSDPPGTRNQYAMAYDPVRAVVVMFSGTTSTNDTWEWDGREWTQITPRGGIAPSARTAAGMVFDAQLGEMVLWGGREIIGSAFLQDMWRWDGRRWLEVDQGTEVPAPRNFLAMTYDGARARIVLTGGLTDQAASCRGATSRCDDLWEWNSDHWEEVDVSAMTRPSLRYGAAMAYDSRREVSVLFGGLVVGTPNDSDEVWEWDGDQWSPGCTQAPCDTSPRPVRRALAGMAYLASAGEIVLMGGVSSTTGASDYLGDTWLWDGSRWLTSASTPTRLDRQSHVMVFDTARDRVTAFGGTVEEITTLHNDTWAFDGTAWREVGPSAYRPDGILGAAMFYDSASIGVGLFGGMNRESGYDCGTGNAYCQDLWKWTGAGWLKQEATATWPSERTNATWVVDTANSRGLLFGGGDPSRDCTGGSSTVCDDLWSFSGGTFSQLADAPEGRHSHAAAFHSSEGLIALGGYKSPGGVNNDTRAYDGSWSSPATPANLLDRQGARAIFDGDAVLLFGGMDGATYHDDVWKYDKGAWSQVNVAGGAPEGRAFFAFVSDSINRQGLLFGGSATHNTCTSGSTRCNDVWSFQNDSWVELPVFGTLPGPRSSMAAAFDADRAELVVYGGSTGSGTQQYDETWALAVSPTRAPGFELTADLSGTGILSSSITNIATRAVAAGNSYDATAATVAGASLRIWTLGGETPGTWQEVDSNSEAAAGSQPHVTNPQAALLAWESGPVEAPAYAGNHAVRVRITPRGQTSTVAAAELPEVALDYVEVTVSYQTPL
jgi:hypothetical protein